MQVTIPAAGLGTRFLPYTLSVPKEMLPLLEKPAIHYILAECLLSDYQNITIITHPEKKSLLHYLEYNNIVHENLFARGYKNLLAERDFLVTNTHITTIFQHEPRGLGDAILLASKVKLTDFIAVALPDDIIFHHIPALQQLKNISEEHQCSVIGIVPVSKESISSYGAIRIKHQVQPGLFEIDGVVEKPRPQDAPSLWAITGRYILDSAIFEALAQHTTHSQQELGLTDGIQTLLLHNKRILAYHIKGTRHDIGNPQGWAQAITWLMQNSCVSKQLSGFPEITL